VSLAKLQYRVLFKQDSEEVERRYASELAVRVGDVLTLQSGEGVVVWEVVSEPTSSGPGVLRAESAEHFRS
jgi:hypothetical protein